MWKYLYVFPAQTVGAIRKLNSVPGYWFYHSISLLRVFSTMRYLHHAMVNVIFNRAHCSLVWETMRTMLSSLAMSSYSARLSDVLFKKKYKVGRAKWNIKLKWGKKQILKILYSEPQWSSLDMNDIK